MFRSLLTPLRTAFELSPQPISTNDNLFNGMSTSPEDFARDVRVEIVRRTVEELKVEDKLSEKVLQLSQIHTILAQDSETKDVFSELDGFIVVVNVLTGLQEPSTNGNAFLTPNSAKDETDMREEATRLCFMVVSEAMATHTRNRHLFEKTVGYDTLEQAIMGLASTPSFTARIFGLLLSLALETFSLYPFFTSLPVEDENSPNLQALDLHVQSQERRWLNAPNPKAILVLLSLNKTVNPPAYISYAVYKAVERIVASSHRNQATLNELGITRLIFDRLYPKAVPHVRGSTTTICARNTIEDMVLQKLLRRLLEMGSADMDEARHIFASVLRGRLEPIIDPAVLELLRSSSRAKWPEFFSLHHAAALTLTQARGKVFPPPSGFTFSMWLYVEKMPSPEEPLVVFGARSSTPSRWIAILNLISDGRLEFSTPSTRGPLVTAPNAISKGRWTHIALVHHALKTSSPTIRLYIDGNPSTTLNATYPKPSPPPTTFYLGCDPTLSPRSRCRWSLASAHLLSLPLSADLARLIHRLGPRYVGNFQDTSLFRFLTYEASTSLNIHIFENSPATPVNSAGSAAPEGATLAKALTGGIGFSEEQILFTLSPRGVAIDSISGVQTVLNAAKDQTTQERADLKGDIRVCQVQCMDVAVWRLGGPAIPLQLIEIASTSKDLTNALAILSDVVRTSWQNSEAMEGIHGYDVLSLLLRSKGHIMTEQSFQTLFEFLGLDFGTPENSTIVNTIAYRSIALDFQLWATMPIPIQKLYFEHFTTLLEKSKFRRFNSKQRFSKKFGPGGIVRQLLFFLQTDLYPDDMIPILVEALRVIAARNWSTDTAIKPIISYLAAKLHPSDDSGPSPRSITSAISHFDRIHTHEKAEQVLEAFVSIMNSDSHLVKLNAALPVARICILLLGPSPSPVVAAQILALVNRFLGTYSNFSRKLELVSFWAILKAVLPSAWNPMVHVAAFDLLLGRSSTSVPVSSIQPGVKCPHILPAILTSLDRGLDVLVQRAAFPPRADLSEAPVDSSDPSMEVLVEELIDLHSSSPTFRHVFKSKAVTAIFITSGRSFITKIASTSELHPRSTRLSDKLCHLALMLSLDSNVDQTQKKELMEILKLAEMSSDQIPAPLPSDSLKRRSLLGFSTRLDMQAVTDRTVQKSLGRIAAWRQTVISTEKTRRRKTYQDLRENLRRIQRHTEWRTLVQYERGLWPKDSVTKWKLDEAEGPYRIRKKLEPDIEQRINTKVTYDTLREVSGPEDDVSVNQVTAPWDESYEFSVTEGGDEERQLEEDMTEDKHRRVRHELEAGDVILDVRNATRVVGVDSSPGLFILGKTHMYMLDGLVESSSGEIIEASEAPKDFLSVPGTLMDADTNSRARRWNLNTLAAFSKRTYLFREVSLEIYFKDSRSLLLVFPNKADREHILNKLQLLQFKSSSDVGNSPAMLRSPLLSFVSAKVNQAFQGKDEISTAQRRWQAREISNFAYLSIINQASGRTPNDLTQYPVFPWVLKDYASPELDLKSPDTYRDFSAPMGALTEPRREAAQTRHDALLEIGEKPFHYGTHFSSSMITSHFLVRLAPFSRHFKVLQGGEFDLPDRLFQDVQRAWESASHDSRGDVRELIPEFFTCPEFLLNLSNLDLGKTVNGGKIEEVGLPAWARGDPGLFIKLHREALESDYVSRHLPAWIDLIWGCKQRDIASLNVFHPLSYEGAIDLDAITDPHERAATVGIIHNFGQTPRKIFSTPHPPRFMDGVTTLPLGVSHGIPEDVHLLVQSPRPVRAIKEAVSSLSVDLYNERVVPCGAGMSFVPQFAHEHVEWGFQDQSLRFFVDRRLAQVSEAASVKCLVFCDSDTLVTGSADNLVSLWRLSHGPAPTITTTSPGVMPKSRLVLDHVMRGHAQPVTCVAASRPWSLIVSGSEDNTAILWDLNRAQYVRSIKHDTAVHAVAISDSEGHIATVSRDRLAIHTLNAQLIVSLRLSAQERIHSLAFHEREYSPIGVLATGSDGGIITLRSWNADKTPVGGKAIWQIVTLRELRLRKEIGLGSWTPGITSLKFIDETLYSGDEEGRVFAWTLEDK